MKRTLTLFATMVLIAATGCGSDVEQVSTVESAAKKPPPDLAPPPDLTPLPPCPTTIDCASTNPGPGWWLGTNSYSAPLLSCNWANFNPPYYAQTSVLAPAGCQNCVADPVLGRYDCTAN